MRLRSVLIGCALFSTGTIVGVSTQQLASATVSSGERTVLVPIEPCRLADTRAGANTVGPKSSPLGPGETHTLDSQQADVPCSGAIPTEASALALNITALNATEQTFLTVWADGDQPDASSLNPAPNQPPTPNAVTTNLSSANEFRIFNSVGSVNVIVDVVGYYEDHDHDDRYAQRTGTILLDSSAFTSRFGTDDFFASTVFGGYFSAATSFRPEAVASIPLPVGTTITEVTYHFRDSTASSGLAFRLYSTPLDSLSQAVVPDTAVATSGAPGIGSAAVEPNLVIPSDQLIGVDVGVENWEAFGNALAVRAVEIDYVLPS